MAIKTAVKQYYNLCGGINTMTSGLLMKPDEIQHSTNAGFDTIGLIEKSLGKSSFWDLGLPASTAPLTVTTPVASPGVVNAAGHLLAINTPIVFEAAGDGEALPTGIVAGTTYYVSATGYGANSFQISGTIGGASINFTGTNTGSHRMYTPTTAVSKMQQLGSDYYSLVGSVLYKKNGAAKTGVTPTAGGVKSYSNLETMLDNLFFVTTTGIINSYNGTTVSATSHLINAPTAIDFIKAANGRMFAFSGDRVYQSSYPQRVVTTIVGDQTTVTTIYVNSTKYLKSGNKIDIYDASLTTKNHDSLTIAAVTSGTTFTVSGAITVANGDVIVYEDGYNVDTIMWSTDEETGDWFFIQGNDGNPTGAAEQAGTLVIIKPQSLWRYTETALGKIGDVGTNAPETFRIIGKTGVFANNNGIYMVEGNDIMPISTKVKKYIDGITSTNIPYMCAGVDSDKYRIWIGDTTHESVNECEITFEPQTGRYAVNSDTAISSYANFIVSNVLGAYVGTSAGKILKLNDTYKNDTANIEFFVKTRDEYLGSPSTIKLFRRVVFYTKPGTLLDVRYAVDGGDFNTLGQIDAATKSFDLFDIRGSYITFTLSEVSGDQMPGILGYEIWGDRDEDAE